jgi:hypothetical protein
MLSDLKCLICPQIAQQAFLGPSWTELQRSITMSAERKKVLELLATGKITTEEAEKLLNKLDTLAGAESESGSAVSSEAKPSDSKS